MSQNNLLAFYVALTGADTNLADDPDLKQLCNKLELLNQKPDVTPQAWENVQSRLIAALSNHAPSQQLYQDTWDKLETTNIPPDLLPTQAELATAQPANRKIGKLGYHPGNPEKSKNYEIINIGITILSNPEPQKTAQTLLQRLLKWLNE